MIRWHRRGRHRADRDAAAARESWNAAVAASQAAWDARCRAAVRQPTMASTPPTTASVNVMFYVVKVEVVPLTVR